MYPLRTVFLLLLICAAAPMRAQVAGLDCDDPPRTCLLAAAAELAEQISRSGLRDEIHFSVAVALARMDRLDEALDTAGLISNSRTLAEVLGEISGLAARAGNFERAYAIALDIVDARVRSARIAAFEALAVEQAARGQVDAAFDTVFAIDNPFRRSEAQAAIAISVARSGDIRGAIRAASRIATNYWFTTDQHRLKIASGLVSRSSDFDQFWFYEALATIAQIQAETGDLAGALATAKAIPDVGGRSRATARIAAVQAAAGDIGGARATARRIEAAYGDLDAMVAIAARLAHEGQFDEALALAGDIALAYGDAAALVAVAVRQARHGLLDAGLETAAGIDNLESRTQALAGIATAMVRGGRTKDALRVAEMIPEAGDRADVVHRIAVILADAGEAARALAVAETHADRRDRDEIVVAVLLAQAAAGDTGAAIETALGIEDEMFRGIALAGIAPYLP